MKKLIFVQLSFLFSLFISAKIEVLDRVAIIVNDGVIMESQVDDLVESTRLRFLEQGAEPPPASSLIEEIKEQLIVLKKFVLDPKQIKQKMCSNVKSLLKTSKTRVE